MASLMGEDAVEVAFRFAIILGPSKKLPGWRDPLLWCDRLEAPLDALRRSWLCPALNCTRRGDDGWETLLGEALGWVNSRGEDGLLAFFAADMVLFSGMGMMGLDSKDGDGDMTAGDELIVPDLL